MKFAKSILLASATAFVSFAATAADLPKKSAPAPVCSFGAGFMMLPGTDTCLKIGGSVQHFSYYNVNVGTPATNTGYSSRNRFQLNADARTNTAMGVLRSFVELRMLRGPGTSHLGADYGLGNNYASPVSTVATMQAAFIQFAGFTAGYAASPFNFNAGFQSNAIAGYFAPTAGGVNQLAYTASLGSGLTATVAVVDNNYTRIGGGATFAGGVYTAASSTFGNAVVYGGNQTPDLVANVNLTQAWGQLQAQGALHRVHTATGLNETGYAVGAGAVINLPMLGAGDTLYINGTYGKGAVSYLRDDGNNDNIYANRLGNGGGDAYYNATGGLTLTTGWSVYAGARHFWNSSLYSSVYGGVQKIENGSVGVAPAVAGIFAASNPVSVRRWSVGSNVTWTPVRNFDLSLEATYYRTTTTTAGVAGADVNGLATGLRVNRAF